MSTSKRKKSPGSYHHGNLRDTLIEIGSEMLVETSPEQLSLRQLAKQAGVSHNAPYQHFENKEGLIAAIAEAGFRLLATALDAADPGADDATPVERLEAVMLGYVAFALGHPGHLRVMFGDLPQSQYPDLFQASMEALGRLVAVVAAGQAAGVFVDADTDTLAAVLWTQVHGISTAALANKIPPHLSHTPERLTKDAIRLMCEGIVT